MKTISVLVPTYNEEENVCPLSKAIIGQMESLKEYDYELIFIDNDSHDSTREKIRELCSENTKIKAIFNAKNFGQFNSPYYGILQANGDCVIAMCADFQDPVELIPQYVKAWEEGYKIVLGQKISSKESKMVYRFRQAYYRFMKKHSEIDFLEQVTGSGLYDREFIEVMRKIDDSEPFLRGVVAEMGYNIKLIPYEQPKRRAGKSSNNIFKYYDGAVQSITAYTKIGVRAAVVAGSIFTTLSVISIIATVAYKLLNWDSFSISEYWIQLAILLGTSLQILFIGIVGEYVLDINKHVRKRPLVVESERINFNQN
ncbi:glycosyltransferase family 2 protein [Methanomethylophilus alvi]|uniref:glycosyltransferase family 2 protein n=1 Tax=Methanomethylophilus alvi TaxID=1291540 RepID=UPI0037DDB1D4